MPGEEETGVGKLMRMYSRRLRLLVMAGLPPTWLYNHSRRKYVEQKILATPPWVSHKEMMELHRAKMRITEETGIPHRLDHIIPLNHPMVCGLNVPWNIQIITHAQNTRKGNRFNPEQLELIQ